MTGYVLYLQFILAWYIWSMSAVDHMHFTLCHTDENCHTQLTGYWFPTPTTLQETPGPWNQVSKFSYEIHRGQNVGDKNVLNVFL